MKKFSGLIEETLGYQSAPDKTNQDPRYLIAPSQNVIISRQKKVGNRSGVTRLGAANTAATEVRNAFTWHTSTGTELQQRFYDDELEVYLGTVDGTVINAWNRVRSGWSTTEQLRADVWWDTGENLDLQLMVNGDDDHYAWNGAAAVVASVTANTITKSGTNTFAQNRFYTTGNKTLINVRTGTEFTYSGGETTLTLTGVAGSPVTDGMVAGDVLVQKVVTSSNSPAASRNNHTVHVFENQAMFGSDDDSEVYLSSNTSHTTFSTSSPRVEGEGELMVLDGPCKGIKTLGKYFVVFAGNNGVFRSQYTQITVSTTLAEVLTVKKVDTGDQQGSYSPDTIVSRGNSLIYLSNEPAVRYLQDPDQLEGTDPKTLSNPIKPDIDAENFAGAHARWYRNGFYLSAPANSHLYILEFVEDADGKLRRFWQAPQILPIGPLSVSGGLLYGHSNTNPETFNLFATDVYSDINSSDEKIPIHAIAAYVYNTYGKRANLKTFDEYHVEGEITPNTIDLNVTLNYGFGGYLQTLERTIDGSDFDILQANVILASLGQQPLAQVPLGADSAVASDASRFAVDLEVAPDDFDMLGVVFSTNETDRFWSIVAHGPNIRLSRRQNSSIKK